jgi:hypothetical protein
VSDDGEKLMPDASAEKEAVARLEELIVSQARLSFDETRVAVRRDDLRTILRMVAIPIPADDAVERVRKRIENVSVPHDSSFGTVTLPSGERTLGYYLSVGIDHFEHPHERYAELLTKAAAVALDAISYSAPDDDAVTRVAKAISDARWERACKALGTSDYVRYEENWPMLIPEAEAVIEGAT